MPKNNTDSEPPATPKGIPSPTGMRFNPESPTFGPSSPATGSETDQEQNTPDTPPLNPSAISDPLAGPRPLIAWYRGKCPLHWTLPLCQQADRSRREKDKERHIQDKGLLEM